MDKKGYYAVGGIVGLYIVIIALFLTNPSSDYYEFFVRFFALTGLYALSIATLMTPFLKEIYQMFGKPFLKVHHAFAAVGLAGATLHPVVFALEVSDWTVFKPDTSSWLAFWELAGRPALILIYIAVVAALIRTKMNKYWRALHSLMYVVLFFVLVHGILIGTDFENTGILVIYILLFLGSMIGFVYKRYQKRQLKH